ncbi:hypothetical protein MN608_00492 [Microdochium nivale]|nr:hypothetical protein MN608_00492 [Microdochium nivale]
MEAAMPPISLALLLLPNVKAPTGFDSTFLACLGNGPSRTRGNRSTPWPCLFHGLPAAQPALQMLFRFPRCTLDDGNATMGPGVNTLFTSLKFRRGLQVGLSTNG